MKKVTRRKFAPAFKAKVALEATKYNTPRFLDHEVS